MIHMAPMIWKNKKGICKITKDETIEASGSVHPNKVVSLGEMYLILSKNR